jgi:hypothetical protein
MESLGLILLSLLFTLVFGFVSLLILNLCVYLWESQRIDSLASRIPLSDLGNVIDKNNVQRGFTSKEWNGGFW